MKNLDEIISAVVNGLTPQERAAAIVYVRRAPVAAGTQLQLGPAPFDVPQDGYLVFVDRQPLANWGHSCRYMLFDMDGAQSLSVEARFPFPRAESGAWRIAHRAEGVPDAALLVTALDR